MDTYHSSELHDARTSLSLHRSSDQSIEHRIDSDRNVSSVTSGGVDSLKTITMAERIMIDTYEKNIVVNIVVLNVYHQFIIAIYYYIILFVGIKIYYNVWVENDNNDDKENEDEQKLNLNRNIEKIVIENIIIDVDDIFISLA